jgi:CRP-like cAMP-binding protein
MADELDVPFRAQGLFAGLGAEDIRRIVEAGERVTFAADQHVFEAGDAGDAMYVVTAGEARVDVGGRFHVLKPGDVFGEMALLAPGTRVATVRAVGDLECLRIPAEPFQTLLREEPDLTLSIMKQLVIRLREVEQRIDAWMSDRPYA